MIGLVMCGGKGTRMKTAEEKLLLRYKKPVIEHVIIALQESGCFSKVVCATSPNAPKTGKFVNRLGISSIETEGKDYVNDLNKALNNFDEPVFVSSGDLPLLDAEVVKKIVESTRDGDPWLSILVSKKFLDLIEIKPEYVITCDNKQYAYTGISIVNPKEISELRHVKESYVVINDKRVAINLNTKGDYDLLCAT